MQCHSCRSSEMPSMQVQYSTLGYLYMVFNTHEPEPDPSRARRSSVCRHHGREDQWISGSPVEHPPAHPWTVPRRRPVRAEVDGRRGRLAALAVARVGSTVAQAARCLEGALGAAGAVVTALLYVSHLLAAARRRGDRRGLWNASGHFRTDVPCRTGCRLQSHSWWRGRSPGQR